MTANVGLSIESITQELESLQVNELNPLSPEVIRRQATINIASGTIGHVAHGKSTIVKAISGVHTVRFKHELVRNITIKLGYANAKVIQIFQCTNPECPKPDCFKSYKSDKEDSPICERPDCNFPMKLVRHVSFVDCPGHDILMATMLNGAAVMDAALLLVAANEPCPQPQTAEHLGAIDIMRLDHIIILQNKIDLVRESEAKVHFENITSFVQGTRAASAPIIPVSGQLKINIDYVCEHIVNTIPIPLRDFVSAPKMIIIRSFDVNRPGTDIDHLKGGVAGGSILKGVLRIGDEIEVRPGILGKDPETGKLFSRPLLSKVISLNAENNSLPFAVPGGLIGVGTYLDPNFCRGDRLVGRVLGLPNTLPEIYIVIEIEYILFTTLLGTGQEERVKRLQREENVLCNIGSTSTGGLVDRVYRSSENRHSCAVIVLQFPACAEIGDKVALSRRIASHWRLIGYGTIIAGETIKNTENN